MIKKNVLFFACVIATHVGFSQQYSVQEAIDYAIKNNKTNENADLEIEKANQKVKETRAVGLPRVYAEGTFNNFIDIATTVAPARAFNPAAPADAFAELQFGTKYNTSATLNASQMLFDGSFFVAMQTTKKYKAVSQLQKQKSVQDIKEGVLNAYYAVLVSQESIATLESLIETSDKMYQDAKKMYEAGIMEADNVDQLNLSVLNTKNAISTAKNRLELAKTNLKYEMGLPLDSPIETTSSFKEVVTSVTGDVSVNTNYMDNIDYKLLQSQIELGQLNIKYERAKALPTLNAFFSHQQSAFRNEFDFFANKPWYPTTLWGLKLTVPIYGGGMQSAKVSQVQLSVKQNENQLALLEDGLKVQTMNAQSTYNNAMETYTVKEESANTAKRIYERYQIKYKEGIVSTMDLTQAQSQYINAQANFIQSMYDLINSKIQLDKITNKL